MSDAKRLDPGAKALALGRLSRRRGRIGFTYALTLVENGFELAYPWAIGVAVNGLLVGRQEALAPLLLIWIAHLIVGGARQVYDTRLFSKLSADISRDITARQRASGRETSEIAARVAMVRDFIDFLETEIPAVATAMIGLFGGIALLFLYDVWAGAIMAALLLPVGAVNLYFGRRALSFSRSYNDQLEREVDTIERDRPRASRLHFGRLAQWRIRLSNADAASWTLAELFAMGAVALVLIRLAGAEGAMAGDIFAGFAYLLRILTGLDEVPGVVQRVGRLMDVRRRLSEA